MPSANLTEADARRAFGSSRPGSSAWRRPIPVATVDVLLPLFGATAPAPLLPEEPAPRGEYFEPLAGLAVRELFQTGVFPTLFGLTARPETLGFSRRDTLLSSASSSAEDRSAIKRITLSE